MTDHGASLAGRTVLVTGGSGFLGGHLVEALDACGARVVVLRRGHVPGTYLESLDARARCAVVDGDLLAPGLVDRALAEHACDAVFHLAGQTIRGTADRSPVSTFETNVRGTWTVLEACRERGVGRVLVASSDKAYGPHARQPCREDTHELRPRHPYDASKACMEVAARTYATGYGLPVAITRLTNLYGEGDMNRSRLVPEAVDAVLAGRRPQIRSDGSPERDYLHAADGAQAYLALADLLDRGEGIGESFNAGTGTPRSVLALVQAVARAAGTDLEPEILGAGVPTGEIDRQWVDATKLTKATGWTPQIELEEGLARTVAWYRDLRTVRGALAPDVA